MAKANANLTLSIDSFFTDTRIGQCVSINCKHNLYNQVARSPSMACSKKVVSLSRNGNCDDFEMLDNPHDESRLIDPRKVSDANNN